MKFILMIWYGYSSLSYLQDLDVDILKIDKSFVDALKYKNVTPHIIEMAKTLKLKMVAEGIETSKKEEWLRQHGVDYGQGWLYSKALPKEDSYAGPSNIWEILGHGTPHSPSRYLFVDDRLESARIIRCCQTAWTRRLFIRGSDIIF